MAIFSPCFLYLCLLICLHAMALRPWNMIFATTHHLLGFDLTIALDPISCCKKNVYCRYMYRQYMNNMLCLVFFKYMWSCVNSCIQFCWLLIKLVCIIRKEKKANFATGHPTSMKLSNSHHTRFCNGTEHISMLAMWIGQFHWNWMSCSKIW
jgi:hypothetical protein